MDYTTAGAARLLGVKARTVQGYIWDGKLHADRKQTGLDWHYVISREEVERFAGKYNIPLVEETPELSSDQ